MSEQKSLFRQRIRSHQKARGQGKTLRVEGVAEDGMEWALKRQKEGAHLPASEYFGYELARVCNLATPYSAVLTDTDGEPVFGSRIEGGLADISSTLPEDLAKELAVCAGRMSACYAVDLFIANADRHFGNFMFRRRADGSLSAMVIDFSHALFMQPWPLPGPKGTNATTIHIQIMRGMGLWRPIDALTAFGTLASVTSKSLTDWREAMPSQWRCGSLDAMIDWWGTEKFHERLSDCIDICR